MVPLRYQIAPLPAHQREILQLAMDCSTKCDISKGPSISAEKVKALITYFLGNSDVPDRRQSSVQAQRGWQLEINP